MALAAIGGIVSGIGSVLGAVFGFKGKQADTLQAAIKVLGDANTSNVHREKALASIIVAEATSESLLAKNWRPLLMLVFAGLVIAYWFGYTPPHLNEPLSPALAEVFDIVKLGIGGYIGGRTIEKIVASIGLSKTLKTFIEKKLL